MKAPGDDELTLSRHTAPPQPGQDGALLLTPLSAEMKTKMAYPIQHQRELEEFQKAFNDNMENKPVKHDKVHVFMWTWEEEFDDLNVKKEVCIQDGNNYLLERTTCPKSLRVTC